MSAKVSKHLRKQRRARKKAVRQQDRRGATVQQRPRHSSLDSAEQPTVQVQQARTSGVRTSTVARVAAVLAGCGLIGAAGGSAAFHLSDTQAEDPLRVPANYVVAPPVADRLVCPPTPGTPDSLSESGIMEYADRDDSVQTSREALLFASAWGAAPSAQWATMTEDGPGELDQFQEETSVQSGQSSRLLAEREPTLAESPETDLPTVLQVQPLEGIAVDDAPAAAAGFTYRAQQGPQSGLIASSCTAPQPSRWFLGPETASDSASLLTLTNPNSREATVTVTTYTPEGSTGDLGSTTILVPADSVRTINMASLTEGDSAMAVNVRSSGAPVASHLQSSRASGSSGQGTDMLPALAEPGTEHHLLAAPAGTDEPPQLWIHTPGEQAGTVELQVFDSEGQVAIDTPGVFTVEEGEVTVVDVEGLEPGTYDVVVRTEAPSLVAVRSTDDGQQGEAQQDDAQQDDDAQDLSWSAAADEVQPGFGALLPPAGETDMHLFGQGELTYRILDASGASSEDITIDVEADRSTVVPHDQLQDQAEADGLDDAHSLVVTESAGQLRAGTITRDLQGRYSIGAVQAISPTAQYVPLRLQR